MRHNPPAVTLEWVDPETGTRGYLVIDRLINGVCGGGCRMRRGLERIEVVDLARTMTYKWALLGIPMGGAKSGIDLEPDSPDKRSVLKRFFHMIRPYVREFYLTGDDLGTDDREITAVLRELGISTPRYAYLAKTGRLDEGSLARLEQAGTLMWENQNFAEMATGFGVFIAAREALSFIGMRIEKARFTIQGFGKVGGAAARFLHRNGGRILAVSDISGGIFHPEGLDIERLLGLRRAQGIIDRSRLPRSAGKSVDQGSILELDVDCLILAAVSGVVFRKNVKKIRAPLIVEGANNPVDLDALEVLHQRGTLVVPGIAANAAAAGFDDFVLSSPQQSIEADWLFAVISERIGRTTREILEKSRAEGTPPFRVAVEMAEKRLKEWDRLYGSP